MDDQNREPGAAAPGAGPEPQEPEITLAADQVVENQELRSPAQDEDLATPVDPTSTSARAVDSRPSCRPATPRRLVEEPKEGRPAATAVQSRPTANRSQSRPVSWRNRASSNKWISIGITVLLVAVLILMVLFVFNRGGGQTIGRSPSDGEALNRRIADLERQVQEMTEEEAEPEPAKRRLSARDRQEIRSAIGRYSSGDQELYEMIDPRVKEEKIRELQKIVKELTEGQEEILKRLPPPPPAPSVAPPATSAPPASE